MGDQEVLVMTRIVIILLLVLQKAVFAKTLPGFRLLRCEEGYTRLKKDTMPGWYQRIKFLPLSKNKETYISYGGEARFQHFYAKNENWGDAPEDKDGYVLNRYLLDADLHANNQFRTFWQLQSSLAGGRIEASPIDENPLELHQAFVDIKISPAVNRAVTFRLGRQELLYGSQRLISVREGPNNRQSFDALKTMVQFERYKLDFFYGHHVAAKAGIFNDGFNKDTKLWGFYLVRNKFRTVGNIDLYYLGLWKRQALFDDGAGRENRHSIGTRIWLNNNDWKYDVEALYQFGKFSDKTITAWTVSVNTSYTFSNAKSKTEIGLKTELISGDRHNDDRHLQTFNPLFPRGAYFGLAALIGPANLIDVHPSVSLSLTKKLELGVDYDIFWRYSRHDGLYAVSGALIYSGKKHSGYFIGKQAAFNWSYRRSEYFAITAEFTWFDAGDYLKTAGAGKDILFTGITTQIKF
jgi:hypothetical protein